MENFISGRLACGKLKEGVKIIKKEELIQNPEDCSPHVVLLGAGASRAALPNGDATGKSLPIMKDFVEILDLAPLLKEANINPTANFETIYPKTDDNLRKTLEKHIHDYFSELKLPPTATLYDRLLLSLREKDAIFTFNWDPFLFDAYQRNCTVVSLPEIFFLHGNVRIGSCNTDHEWGMRGKSCPTCNKEFVDVPLLYPIEEKDYFTSNEYTKLSWENADDWFSRAFTITIFGYSAPDSDEEAVNLLHIAWLSKSDRKFGRVEVIDIGDTSIIHERWKKFTPTFYLDPESSFEDSRLWGWPRRSCEALFYPMTQGRVKLFLCQ